MRQTGLAQPIRAFVILFVDGRHNRAQRNSACRATPVISAQHLSHHSLPCLAHQREQMRDHRGGGNQERLTGRSTLQQRARL